MESAIPRPKQEQEWFCDDEKAAQSAVLKVYPLNKINLCHFHVSKNIVKRLVTEGLSNYFKKCETNEELWLYGQIKKILAISLLPETEISNSYLGIMDTIYDVIGSKLNAFEKEHFDKFFNYLSKN